MQSTPGKAGSFIPISEVEMQAEQIRPQILLITQMKRNRELRPSQKSVNL
jgi:hypothetical protein